MDQFKLLECFNKQAHLLKDHLEVLTKIPLQSHEVEQLYKGFTNSSNKIHILMEVMHEHLKK